MDQINKYRRYERQIALKDFGTEAQDKLFNAKILVIGAGGLGCPVLQYLAAAGVGTIGIVDFDVVEITNLQRQTLYTMQDIGKSKATAATEKLKLFNPDIQFSAYQTKLDTGNALEIIGEYDLVIDGSDNFATRYLLNDACVLLHKPLIYGAVLRYEGQVGVFNMQVKDSTYSSNYRDLFPVPPKPGMAPSCNEAGVLGILPSIIGSLQAAEAIKIITGIGEPLCNKILSCNVLDNSFYEFTLSPSVNPAAHIPASKEAFKNFDYEWFCDSGDPINKITPEEFDNLRASEQLTIIDVREENELPSVSEFSLIQIPLSRFKEAVHEIPIKNKIVVFCQSGKRSATAVTILREKIPEAVAYSLEGGIAGWNTHKISQIKKSSPIKI